MDGVKIPFSADLSELQNAFKVINQSVVNMGASIQSSLEKSNGAFTQTAKSSGVIARSFATVWQSVSAGASSTFRGMVSAAKAAGSAINSAFRGIASLPGRVLGSVPGLPLAGILSAAGAMALLVTQVKAGGAVAGDIERLDVALTALTGSGTGANTILASMRDNWLKTGTAISQQAPNIQKFLALGFSSGDALKLQKNILDVAGAVGMTTTEASLLGTALAQVKAKGIVSMEELRQQIAEKGVPVFEALAQKLGVTQVALIKLVSDGKVPAAALIDIFMNMEGSLARFKGGAERMGGTFVGLSARMQGAWSLLRAEFMAPVLDALKPVLEAGIARVQTLMTRAKELGAQVGNAISLVFAAFRDGNATALFQAGLAVAVLGAVDKLMRGLRGAVAFLATALPPIFDVLTDKLADPVFWQGISLLFQGIAAAFASQIRRALGQNDLADALSRQAEIQTRVGGQFVGEAGNPNTGAIVAAALTEAMQAAKVAAGKANSTAFQKAIDDFRSIINKLQGAVDADNAFRPVSPEPAGTGGGQSTGSAAETVQRAVAPAVMSLTRIGGGGFANTVLNNQLAETRKQTGVLSKILKAVEGQKPEMTAKYA